VSHWSQDGAIPMDDTAGVG